MKVNLKRKTIAVLLICMLVTGLLPAAAFAANLTSLNVNGTDILSAPDNKITCGEGTAEYDLDSNTLTLTNITIEGEFLGSAAIYAVGDLTIRLVGTNTITSGYYGIYGNNGTITIGGEGKLIIQSDNDCIRGDNISIGIVDETGAPAIEAMGRGKKATGIYATNVLTIQNGAEITAKSDGDSYALCGEGGITIADSTVNTTSSGSEQNVICSASNFSIDNSTVAAIGTSQDAFPAIYAAGNINITNKSDVEATSSGMRGIFTDRDMTVTDSAVTATGTTHEGMVVVGTLTLNNSSLTASSKPNDIIPAIVTKNFNINNSEVTAKGGFDLFDWYNGNIDDISFGIAPANGKLAEFKADGENWDGSAAKHFKEGNESPYDTAINFSADEMNWLSAYRYIHIGEHIHAGGTATCTESAVCEDCGRGYGAADSSNHDFQNGRCTRCGVKDPNYIPPAPPVVIYYDITATQPEHGTITLSTDRIYRYGDVDVTLTAEEGYEIKDLLINGKSVGAVSSYTIEDVTEDIHVTAVFGETEAAENDRIAKGVQNTTIRMYYKKSEIGKGWIKLHYKKSYGFKVDNYEIFRSAKKKTGFGDKPYFVTKKNNTSGFYKNTKNVKKGTRYFYKMRGVREIGGQTYYTQWSNVVMRTGR